MIQKIVQENVQENMTATYEQISQVAAKNIMDAREDGPFLSKEELKVRARLNKNVMETLEESGCLKGLEESNQISFI